MSWTVYISDVAQRFPFLVVYRVQEASREVDVVTIANTYRDPKRWQKRQ